MRVPRRKICTIGGLFLGHFCILKIVCLSRGTQCVPASKDQVNTGNDTRTGVFEDHKELDEGLEGHKGNGDELKELEAPAAMLVTLKAMATTWRALMTVAAHSDSLESQSAIPRTSGMVVMTLRVSKTEGAYSESPKDWGAMLKA